MGRRKFSSLSSASRDDKSRKKSFATRSNGMVDKGQELSQLCGVDVCIIWSGPSDSSQLLHWPPNRSEAARIVRRFQACSEKEILKNRCDLRKALGEDDGGSNLEAKLAAARKKVEFLRGRVAETGKPPNLLTAVDDGGVGNRGRGNPTEGTEAHQFPLEPALVEPAGFEVDRETQDAGNATLQRLCDDDEFLVQKAFDSLPPLSDSIDNILLQEGDDIPPLAQVPGPECCCSTSSPSSYFTTAILGCSEFSSWSLCPAPTDQTSTPWQSVPWPQFPSSSMP